MSSPSPASPQDVRGPAVDWQIALEAMGGDEQLLRSIVDVLLDEAPRQLESIRVAAAAAQVADLRRAAHTLKGSLRYFAAEAAAHQAEQIEQLAQSGATDVSPDALARLRTEVDVVLRELEQFRRGGAPASS